MKAPTVSTLYSPRYDFPRYVDAPREIVMLATLPRSGSTLLGLEMWRTGVLGAPLEYFNLRGRRSDPAGRPKRPAGLAYLHNLFNRRTSINGVFSFKMFTQDYRDLLERDTELLNALHSTKVIYLTRLDRLSQAISYARASQTGRWFHDAPAVEPEAGYSRAAILKALRWIRGQEQNWESLFQTTNCKPLRIFYEEFSLAPDSMNPRLTEYVGVEPDQTKRVNLPVIAAQADAVSAEWRRRFMSEGGLTVDDA